jgi:KDO2-lipid IV(A) lauroyltransferase
MITCLEYPKLAREKDISRIAYCENPDEAKALLEKSGIIFFCGHQANWELLFLEGTSRMPGVAIGRPIKNKLLYKWVVGIRERFGGTIIEPRNALRESLKALKKKCFLGIVGDQGMPKGGFASDFLGRPAFTSPLPAILAYRTGAPLLVATLRRCNGRYAIRYSSPLYADPSLDMDQEVDRLMRKSLDLLGDSILENPSQWLWQHNRWKQQAPGTVKRPYRFDAVRILLPQEKEKLDALIPHLATLRSIYPTEHFTVAAPKGADVPHLAGVHLHFYEKKKELFEQDYASKIVFNFTESPSLSRHFRKLSAFQTLTMKDLYKIARSTPRSLDASELFYKVLCHAR